MVQKAFKSAIRLMTISFDVMKFISSSIKKAKTTTSLHVKLYLFSNIANRCCSRENPIDIAVGFGV